ncbi:MAG: histidine--tRNA ligase [archaeon]|nr:MAG: histidine--tRNA ligase [archaeon]
MTEKFQPVKGTRDFLPEEKILRQSILDVLRKAFEEFGFSPLETPAIETWEIATKKGSSDSTTDVYREIYRFKDQGERELTLRYELTFPLARVIAANPQIPKPFKRYQIGKVWRDGPVKTGRYREFWQCDVDTVGSASLTADAEILAMYTKIFKELGLKVVIKINTIKFLDNVLSYAGVPPEKRNAILISLDKLEKIGLEEVVKDAKERGISENEIREVYKIIKDIDPENPDIDNDGIKEGLEDITELSRLAISMGAKNIYFVPTLTRGLTYYTGPIFEVFLKSGALSSSLAGGGRWDNMISDFMGSKEKVPATGTSFGLDTIYDAMLLEGKLEKQKTVTDVFVIPIKTKEYCLGVVRELRELGINADMDIMDRSISKNLSYANSLGIPYCIIVGHEELMKKVVKLRDMKSGEERLISLAVLKNEIKYPKRGKKPKKTK